MYILAFSLGALSGGFGYGFGSAAGRDWRARRRVREIRRLRIEPGDRLVVHVDRFLAGYELQALRDQVERAFGDVDVAIMLPGLGLEVVNKVRA